MFFPREEYISFIQKLSRIIIMNSGKLKVKRITLTQQLQLLYIYIFTSECFQAKNFEIPNLDVIQINGLNTRRCHNKIKKKFSVISIL